MRNGIPFKSLFACGIAWMSMAVASAQPLSIYTLAGHDATGSKDGVSSTARFKHPNGIAVDGAGNVYVADTENSTIRRITTNGMVSTFAGAAGSFGSANGVGTNAQFYGPQGVAVDGAGFVYVADTGNHTIRKITPAGVVSTLAGSAGILNSFDGAGSSANFYQPQSLTVDGAGNVYVADTGNHTIRKIAPAGLVSTLAGLAGNPGGIDGTNSKARFNWPSGIASDAATNLYVTDFNNHTIRKITPSGMVSTIAGAAGLWGYADGTNGSARFFQPQGILVDNAGNLYVSDSGNQVIRRILQVGTNWVVSTVAGLSGFAGSADGTDEAARFYFPAGVARDAAGYFYVADLGNNNIRTERVVAPPLQLVRSGNQLIFSWPVAASGFVLQSAQSVSPGAQWMVQTNGVAISGDYFVMTNGVANAAAFYRLHR